jgi:peptidoglycan/xylan/chitin deacetylase (PgdA/CDA1 family)
MTSTPTTTSTPQNVTQHVPILMYHYLSTPPADADAIRRDLSVSPEQFEAHLTYLRQRGYETTSLEQLAYAIKGVIQLPAKPIIITFDDGYRDNYENAFPILKKNGFAATFFIFTQPIDENNLGYLSWDMVKEMHRAGMEFGSHSYRHLDMRQRDVDFLVYEIVGSSEAIAQRTGEPVRFFSYPAGRYDDLVIKVLESAKFWGAVTTQWGATESYDNRFELPRLRIRGNDTAEDLANKLAAF